MKELKSFIELWGKFMFILTPSQKRLGVLVFFMSLFGSLVEMLGVSVILPLVQVMIDPDKLYSTRLGNSFFNIVHVNTNKGLIITMTSLVIVVYFFKNLFLSFCMWVRTKFSMKVQREMSLKMIRSYNQRGYDFFRNTTYSIYSRGVGASASAVNASITLFFKLIAELLTIASIFVFVCVTDWVMAFTLLMLAGICLWLIIKIFKRRMQEAGKIAHEYSAKNSQWLVQLYYGIKEIIVMDRKDYFINNYENTCVMVQKNGIKLAIAQEMPAYIIEAICIMGIMCSVGIRVCSIPNAADYIPKLAAFAVAAFRVLPSLGRISSNINALVYQIPYVNEAYYNIREANELVLENDLISNHEVDATQINNYEADLFSREIYIDNLFFKFDDGVENVIDGISIRILRGESLAFIGESGAGKSTLVDIILGLLLPQKGRILVDDIDITYDNRIRSSIFGFVPQTPYLIADTIRHNVAFGLYDYQIEDNHIWNALEKAQLSDFVRSLPEGLDTIIGERGTRLSGGQAQRLVIARALYNNPKVLVLDEATSALDNETEKAVMESIEDLHGKITMIIIAHRLTTVRDCDKIYEICDGRIRERKYEDLL